jgi:hypothetical protein
MTACAWLVLAPPAPAPVFAQVKASVPAGITPAWTKGIQPISRESYWNAVECGKQKSPRPACVFYDADLCKNADFTLALYTPYKKVAYEVWQAVSQEKEPPTPSYGEAQRTRVVLGVKAARTSQNPITALNVKRGGKTVAPISQTLDGGGGTFIFDFGAFAPTGSVTLEFVGKASTVTCTMTQAVLARLR